jgi:hypothetical protein
LGGVARVEVAQTREIHRAKAEPLEQRVVDALVGETEIERHQSSRIGDGTGARRDTDALAEAVEPGR